MTREQKIQNILKATQEYVADLEKQGKLTPEMFEAIIMCQTNALLGIDAEK